jgi:hypothetical protein
VEFPLRGEPGRSTVWPAIRPLISTFTSTMHTHSSPPLGHSGRPFSHLLGCASRILRLTMAGAFVALGLGGCGGGGSISEPPPTPAPTLQIRSGLDGAATGTFQVDFVFNGDVAGFSQDKISLSRGTLVAGSFKQLNAREFTALITPPSNSSGVTTVQVRAGSFTALGSLLTNVIGYEFSKPYDTVKPGPTEPTPTFSHVMRGTGSQQSALVTIVFDIDVEPFTVDKIQVASATVSDFTRVSAREYRLVLTPPGPVSALMLMALPEGSVKGAVVGGTFTSQSYQYGVYVLVPPGS